MRANSVRLGISGDIKKLERIAHSVMHSDNHPFNNIHHFSLGLRPWEVLNNSLIDFLVDHNISLSAHPTDINFSGKLNISDLKQLKETLISWPVLYIEEDMGLWRADRLFLGAHQLNPIMNEASLRHTTRNILEATEILERPMVIENPPIYYEAGHIDFWDYYLELCTASKSKMALDIGHYVGYCKSRGRLPAYPSLSHKLWNHIRTVHISGVKSWHWNGIPVWLDQHADPFKTLSLNLLNAAVARSEHIENVLLEMEGAAIAVESTNIKLVSRTLKGFLYHG